MDDFHYLAVLSLYVKFCLEKGSHDSSSPECYFMEKFLKGLLQNRVMQWEGTNINKIVQWKPRYFACGHLFVYLCPFLFSPCVVYRVAWLPRLDDFWHNISSN